MNANVTVQSINCDNKSNPHRQENPDYWSRRRAWWRAHKAQTGTDWVGVAKTILDVDQYLNGAAVVCDDYDTLSGTFSSACREADAARGDSRPRARRDSLPTSTAETIDWLLRYCDAERLRKFLEGRPEAELAKIKNYIAWKNIDEIMAIARGEKPKGNGNIDPWGEPDWSLLDDRRGQLPEFPIEALSPECRGWVERAAHGAGVTTAHVATPLIGIASSLIGTARRVQASRSFTQPMTTWTATVGFSGTGKTPGIDCTKRALALVERNRKEKVAEMQRAHETRREASKALRDAWSKQLKGIAADSVVDLQKYRSTAKAEPAMPREAIDPGPFIAPRLHVSNATIERLAQLLEVQPQGALLLSDELAGLFLNMSRYSGGQDNEFWLEAWNGGHYTVERMSRPAISIDHLLVGVVGGMQPDKLAR